MAEKEHRMKFDNNNAPRENPPAKMTGARLIGIYDIGLQPGSEKFPTPKEKLVFVYELRGKDRMSDGKPFTMTQWLTSSLSKKGTLGKVLQTLGCKIKSKNDNFWELPKDFAMTDLLGVGCMLVLKANDAGSVFIDSITPPIDGMEISEAESDAGFLDLDADDWLDQYNAAPAWIQKRVDTRLGQ